MTFGKELKKAGKKAAEAAKRVEEVVKQEVINPVTNNTTIDMAKNIAAQMKQSRETLLEQVGTELQEDCKKWLPSTAELLNAKLAEIDSHVARLNDMVHNQEHGIAHMQSKSSSDLQSIFESISAEKVLCEQYIQEAYTLCTPSLREVIATMKRIQQIAEEAQKKCVRMTETVAEESTAWTELPSSKPEAIISTVIEPMQEKLKELNETNTELQQRSSTGATEIEGIDREQGNTTTALQQKSSVVEGEIIILQAKFDVKLAELQQQISANVTKREALEAKIAAEAQEQQTDELAAHLGISSTSTSLRPMIQ